MNEDLFKFYWVKILPKAVGAKQFTEEKKFFGTPCSAHVGNRFIASVATEAFASLAFENYHTRWPAKWAIKSKEAAGKQLKFVRSEDALANVSSKYYGINVLDEKNKAFRTKWSDPASGQKQYAGWHADGLEKFKTLFEEAKNGRTTDENLAMEARILQELRQKEGIGQSFPFFISMWTHLHMR